MMNMPGSVRECVTPNSDGSYTIFINDTLSPEARIKAYRHAMGHIEGNDFEKADADEIERTAHEGRII